MLSPEGEGGGLDRAVITTSWSCPSGFIVGTFHCVDKVITKTTKKLCLLFSAIIVTSSEVVTHLRLSCFVWVRFPIRLLSCITKCVIPQSDVKLRIPSASMIWWTSYRRHHEQMTNSCPNYGWQDNGKPPIAILHLETDLAALNLPSGRKKEGQYITSAPYKLWPAKSLCNIVPRTTSQFGHRRSTWSSILTPNPFPSLSPNSLHSFHFQDAN